MIYLRKRKGRTGGFGQAETLRRWLAPGEMTVPEIEFDARVGGRYRIMMLRPDGEKLVVRGTIRELRVPEHLSMTWQWDDDDGVPEGNETILRLDFHDREGATELVLTHENFTDAASRGRHEDGWNACLDNLARFV